MVFGRRYRVLEKIGTGGMADVYKAVDEVLGRTVAVKVMHPRYAADPSFAVRFRQEAQAAANLQSPNIVNMYDWGADGDTYYMVMEYVRGNDLKSIILDKGPIPSAKVANIGAQVAAALSVAHGYDIIHRDIKPHNIMVQPDGSVKVMDFGIARAGNTTMTQTGSVLGTAHYVSPEQAQGKELHATSDLYSLGVVLYEAATGRLPFDADTPVAVALKQVNEQPRAPRSVNPNVDPGLEAVIVKAMQKNPSARYQSADEMRRDLLAVASGQAPSEGAMGVAGLAAAGGAAAGAANAPIGQTSVLPSVGGTATRSGYPQGGARPTARKKAPVWPWALVAVALVIAGVFIANAAGLFGSGKIPVPSLTGDTEAAATAELAKDGLTKGTVTTGYSDQIGKGQVMGQDPPNGELVAKGTVVNLVISQGPPLVSVPDVVGKTDSDAIAAIQGAGLTPASGASKNDPKVPAGSIISQDPPANAQAPKGSTVTYIVSLGPAMNQVPDVTGKSKSAATATLKAAGFKVAVAYDFDQSTAEGDVIRQTPTPSDGSYPAGKTVTITVSEGPGAKVPTDLVGESLSDAIDELRNAGFKTSPSPSEVTSVTADSPVTSTDPSGGTVVKPGAKVTLSY